jgi:hypothetical protein
VCIDRIKKQCNRAFFEPYHQLCRNVLIQVPSFYALLSIREWVACGSCFKFGRYIGKALAVEMHS